MLGLSATTTDKLGISTATANKFEEKGATTSSNNFTGTIGAQYKFGQTWGLVGEVEFADGGEVYLLGLRASF